MRLAHVLFGFLFVAAPVLGAQQLRGVVVDSAAGTPVSGAVVMALDSTGTTSARTITGADGHFAFTPAPRPASLRVIRIGYSPRSLALAATDPSASLRVSMSRLPAMLSAVRVNGRELCPGSTERGAAFRLWEQARAGLLAAVVTREAKPADATTLMYERTVLPGDELVRRMVVNARTGRTTRPFVSPESPAAFAQHGYMREAEDRSRDFGAPDADVLLDDSFASVHCFHLQQADAAHPGQIGLAFTPIAAHDTLVDVTGVIWMDATQPALRSLEFRYTSLEPATRAADVGGVIDFSTMPNGVSFIDRWSMRLPVLTEQHSRERTIRDPAQFRERRSTDYAARLAQIIETGGQVLSARWADGVTWHAPRTGISGRIASDGHPAAGAVVSLRGTDYRATANARGEYTITPVIPGRYTLVATDTAMIDYIDERRTERTIHVPPDSLAAVSLELPRFASMLDHLCHLKDMPKETAIILGQIVNEGGLPDPSVHLRATWQATYNNGQFVKLGRDVRINGASQDTDPDDQGRFSICGVATQRPIHVRASRGRAHADTTISVMPDSVFKTLRWFPRLIEAAPPP